MAGLDGDERAPAGRGDLAAGLERRLDRRPTTLAERWTDPSDGVGRRSRTA
jgi:hypothetical protein